MENIVLLTYDSLRADHCGHNGYNRDTTPNLDRLADQGIQFTNSASPASRTNPSMASIFTGEPMVFDRPVSEPDVARNHLNRYQTLAERLSKQGYTTGAFCPNAYASRYYGFDKGFDHFEDFLFSESKYQNIFQKQLDDSDIYTTLRNFRNLIKREEVFRTWDRYVEDIEEWVNNQTEPYFLWVFSLGTHFPFLTPRNSRKYSTWFDQYYYNWKCNQVIDEYNPEISEKTWNKFIDIYDDSVRYADKLIAELEQRLSKDDPTFIVHSDHGEAFGEHGMFGHYYPSFYDENIHVPTVAWNSNCESQTITEPFSLLDLPEYVINNVIEGDLSDPPTREASLMTSYDGRKGRNLIAARSENYKLIRTITDSGVSDEWFELDGTTSDGGNEAQTRSGPSSLQSTVDRQTKHEFEILRLRRAVEEMQTSS